MKMGRVVVFGGVILLVLSATYFFWPQGRGSITFTVSENQTTQDIATSIASKTSFNSSLLYVSAAMVSRKTIVPGNYTLNLPARYANVWEQIYAHSEELSAIKTIPKRPSVRITFPEGITIDGMLKTIAKTEYRNTDALKNYWKPYNSNLRSAYSFLPSDLKCTYGDVESCNKYYLEGFLYPDTYDFFVDEQIESITRKFLDNFAIKNPELIALPNQQIYTTLTLASVVEKETGHTTQNTTSDLSVERKTIAGVFQNRDALYYRWQSDPTVVYGSEKVLCQVGRIISDCESLDNDIYQKSLYNTYVVQGAPIGPISNPSKELINAVLHPLKTNYLYFAADISGKVYFATTNEEHNTNISKLEAINAGLRAGY